MAAVERVVDEVDNVDNSSVLAQFVAARLDARADAIVEEWVDWVRSRVDNPTVDALPHRALLNHIPPVIKGLTEYLINPTAAIREDLLGHLNIHGHIRRDQGYEATDVMAEFDGLAHMVFRAMQVEVQEHEQTFPSNEVLEVFGRLSDGLRAMSYVTIAVYQQIAEERRHALAMRLSDFASSIGHELRNPLNTIAISAAALEATIADQATPESTVSIESIRRATQNAVGLLDDINILAMTQGGESRSRMAALPRLFQDVRVALSPMATEREVEIRFPDEIPRVAVEGLVGSLALANVMTNAIKYSDREKNERWVEVTCELQSGVDTPVIQITVRDNGIGIPADLEDRVFQRAFRAHPGYAEGTGLGLAITQELLVERGGRIELESQEGEGTTVIVQMRAIDAESVAATSALGRPESLMQRSVRAVLESYPDSADRT